MKLHYVVPLGICVFAILALALLTRTTDESAADVPIEGIPADELAQSGVTLREPADHERAERSSDDILVSVKSQWPGARVLDVVLVKVVMDGGGPFEGEPLAWAVSLDPDSVPVPPFLGDPDMTQADFERARTAHYVLELWDAKTGDYLLTVSSAPIAN